MQIIYLHGFNSSGINSDKVRVLGEYFGESNVHTDTFSHDPRIATAQIYKLIKTVEQNHPNQRIILVGTSLGGFYADYFGKSFGYSVVLINPSTDPIKTCERYIGNNINFATGEKYVFKPIHLSSFKDYYCPINPGHYPTLVFLDAGDEILNYEVALEKYNKMAKVKIFQGGDHRFTHMKEILGDIASLEHNIHE
jgi:predicted esterase YcpF (UPF0227 family)